MRATGFIVLLAFAASSDAQVILFFDSRIPESVIASEGTKTIDLGITSRSANPDLYDFTNAMRRVPPTFVPSLYDMETGLAVPVTTTIQKSKKDLKQLGKELYPARDRMAERDAKKELREARDKIKGQGNTNQRLAALEVEVSRLAEIVEYLVEQSESFK